jgi:hypothetical protein
MPVTKKGSTVTAWQQALWSRKWAKAQGDHSMVAQSLTSLRRTEKALYRELCATFATMQRLDAAHCAAEVYMEVSKLYQQLSGEHIAICRELEQRYEERLIARYEEDTVGVALHADRTNYLWESSVAD